MRGAGVDRRDSLRRGSDASGRAIGNRYFALSNGREYDRRLSRSRVKVAIEFARAAQLIEQLHEDLLQPPPARATSGVSSRSGYSRRIIREQLGLIATNLISLAD